MDSEKAQPVYEDYVSRMKAKGLPGAEALKFVRDFLKTGGSKPTRADVFS